MQGENKVTRLELGLLFAVSYSAGSYAGSRLRRHVDRKAKTRKKKGARKKRRDRRKR